MDRLEALRMMQEAECLVDRQAVGQALDRMAAAICHDLSETFPMVLTVMNGGMVVCGELLLRLAFPLEVGYLHATRYGFDRVGSELEWLSAVPTGVAGRTVVLVDDIYDEGITLLAIREACLKLGATHVRTAVLLEKDHDRKVCHDYHPDYVGLTVADRFVFGYGLDVEGVWRNAPGIYAVTGM